MCFGNSQRNTTTTNNTTTHTPNPVVANAATGNLAFVEQMRNAGFTPYNGEMVAGFSPQQLESFRMMSEVAGSGTGAEAGRMIRTASGAPAQRVNAETISSRMSPYMSQYVMNALAPQMAQMDERNAAQDAALDARATMSGAFGDARTGIEAASQRRNQNVERTGMVGQAYNSAFNTAIGAGAQDVANSMQAQNANAGYMEQMLQRMFGGAGALQTLQNQQMGVAQGMNAAGQQQTAQQQAQLTAAYNQWLMGQQRPFQTAQLMNQTIGAGAGAMPASQSSNGQSTQSTPNNSGWGMLGTLAGVALAPFTGGTSMMLGPALGGMMGGGGSAPGAYGGGSGGSAYSIGYGGQSMPVFGDRPMGDQPMQGGGQTGGGSPGTGSSGVMPNAGGNVGGEAGGYPSSWMTMTGGSPWGTGGVAPRIAAPQPPAPTGGSYRMGVNGERIPVGEGVAPRATGGAEAMGSSIFPFMGGVDMMRN
jgi:hypothetical protein